MRIFWSCIAFRIEQTQPVCRYFAVFVHFILISFASQSTNEQTTKRTNQPASRARAKPIRCVRTNTKSPVYDARGRLLRRLFRAPHASTFSSARVHLFRSPGQSHSSPSLRVVRIRAAKCLKDRSVREVPVRLTSLQTIRIVCGLAPCAV